MSWTFPCITYGFGCDTSWLTDVICVDCYTRSFYLCNGRLVGRGKERVKIARRRKQTVASMPFTSLEKKSYDKTLSASYFAPPTYTLWSVLKNPKTFEASYFKTLRAYYAWSRLGNHGKNSCVTATKLGTTNKNFVAAIKNFAGRTKDFVVVTKYFCYSYFNKWFIVGITKPFFFREAAALK